MAPISLEPEAPTESGRCEQDGHNIILNCDGLIHEAFCFKCGLVFGYEPCPEPSMEHGWSRDADPGGEARPGGSENIKDSGRN